MLVESSLFRNVLGISSVLVVVQLFLLSGHALLAVALLALVLVQVILVAGAVLLLFGVARLFLVPLAQPVAALLFVVRAARALIVRLGFRRVGRRALLRRNKTTLRY